MAIVQIDNEGIRQLATSAEVKEFLQAKASAGVAEAQKIFGREVKGSHGRTAHDDQHYATGWYSGVRRVGDHLEGCFGNTAYDAVWVEVGAHAGGNANAPVLGYRPLGRALQEAFSDTHVARPDVPQAGQVSSSG